MIATQRLPRRLHVAAMALCALGFAGAAKAQNVAINATGAAADPHAILDVSSITQGLLIPRWSALPSAVGLPQGLTVFRTGAANVRGLYSVDYGKWIRMENGNNGWDIYGNYLTNAADPNVDFIGTTDNRVMNFRTNNQHRMRLDATTGYLGVGYVATAPVSKERLDVNGAIRQYYVSSPGQETSATDDPGVFRYQTFGNWVGAGDYKYGSNEKLAVTSTNTTQINAVLGRIQNYPLQYAGHWGNVDGTAMEASKAPLWKQPKANGWRAFENPYNEVVNQSWSHFREAVCPSAPNTQSIIPSGVPTPYTMSNSVATGRNDIVTPFAAYDGGRFSTRRQYLYLASELNMELAQVNGNTGAVNGLCPGGLITQIAFWVKRNVGRTSLGANNIDVTVRQAPLGLNTLNGFDNTPNYSGPMSCGTFASNQNWPTIPVGTTNWQPLLLTPAFVWDGISNILIEVAVKYQVGTADPNNNPVGCTNTGFNATFGANVQNQTLPETGPVPNPVASCNNTLNVATRMVDSYMLDANFYSAASHWRPIVRFLGVVATANPAPTSGVNNANYIHYPGALVVEDTSTVFSDIPWGRWRANNPVNNTYWAYQGDGTISAQHGVYDNGSRLNDHVFDRAFDGRVAPSDAAHFGGDRLLNIDEMESFTREYRHLPTMKGREAWKKNGGSSLGDLTNQLWATTETHALYVADLHDKLNVIEMLTNERPITTAEFQVAQQDLGAMADLTDADKARLIADLRKRVTLTSTSR